MICQSWEGGTIDGKFPLLEWLGGWADHCVFLTVRQGTQRVNIKLIPASGAEAEAHLTYWKTAKTLSHPHLLQLMESSRCTIQGIEVVYVITEKADNFLSALIPRKALNLPDVKLFLDPVVDALTFLHERGFGHGSVRPSNIVLAGNQWKLTPEKMACGEIVGGKPGEYDAPEAAAGVLTPASDVWSLGMIVVEAFEQRTPHWDNESKTDPEVPNTLPEPFKKIARGCLRWEPAERISIAEVKALLAGDTLPTKATEPAVRWSEPVIVEPQTVQAENEEEVAADADSFAVAESVEFTPRPRLFTNLGEEDEHESRKGPTVLLAMVVLAVVAVLAVRGYRAGWFRAAETQSSPAPSQPVAPTPQLQPAPAQSENAPAPIESSPASQPSQTQPTPEAPKQAEPEAPKQQEPAQSANATEPPVKPETVAPATKEAANSRGAVVKRVMPDVSPGASGSMRRPVEIELRVSVNEAGTVSKVEYTSQGPGNYFARKSHQAAQMWKFKPPENEGQATASEWVLLFQFDRRKTEVTATEVR